VVASLAAGLTFATSRLRGRARAGGGVAIVGAILALAALSHRLSRHYENDEVLFRANIATNPASWMGHHILAHTLAKKSPDNFDEAERLYRRALELNTHNPDSHYKLGHLISARPERRDEAIAHYREALRLRPAFPEAHNGLAYELAAIPGKQAEAIAHYRKAIEHLPKFVYAHGNLAQLLARLPGNETEALKHFETALQLAPAYASLRLEYAKLLARLPGRGPEALAHLEAIVKLAPHLAVEAHNLIGILHAQAGNPSAARVSWTEALRLDPNFTPARENLKLLQTANPAK
jgi:protein O-mannosyl-transferase